MAQTINMKRKSALYAIIKRYNDAVLSENEREARRQRGFAIDVIKKFDSGKMEPTEVFLSLVSNSFLVRYL
jgi:hypothetical protein